MDWSESNRPGWIQDKSNTLCCKFQNVWAAWWTVGQGLQTTSSCNLSQSYTNQHTPNAIIIILQLYLGWCITQQINTCSTDIYDTHTTCPGTNKNSILVLSSYNLLWITPTISRRRHTKLLKKEGWHDDSLQVWAHNDHSKSNSQLPQNNPPSNGCHNRPYLFDATWLIRLAFALMLTNSLGQCGPELLQFLWNLADHYAQTMFWFSVDENIPQYSLTLQHPLPRKQQIIVNSEAQNTTRIVKEFWHVSLKA